ncbi:MAG: UvrD-helicase domain-containing protein [Acidobacteriota bacterium]|nr:UvrD-helicase domain-containing protein [Acidobacteriota bacterium]
MIDLNERLNEQQVAAATHGRGPQLVLAGAGSGKTRVITHRIWWLVREQGVTPYRVVAVTFTNKAAAEMRQRVETLLDEPEISSFVGTFHRFGLRMLRRYGSRLDLDPAFKIFDDSDQIALVKRALKDEGLAEASFPPRAMLSRISDVKSRLVTPTEFEKEADGFYDTRLAAVYRRYQHLLRRSSGADFDDLIVLPVTLLRDHEDISLKVRSRIDHLLVDEFQDTNHAQLRLVKELIGETGNITAVGDEDQGIYRWRGADLDNVLHFEKSFPGAAVRRLEQNYRSTQTILDAAGELVSHNRDRRGKWLWTDSGAGEKIELYKARDEIDEARWAVRRARDLRADGATLSDIAFLVRTNAQTRVLEDELLRTETPYCLVGGTRFYERAEIKDMVAYLRVVHDPRDELSMRRILNQPPRGIGKTTQRLMESECERLRLSQWDYLALDQFESLPARAAKAVKAFRDLVVALHEAKETHTVVALLEKILESTAYLDLYSGDDPESEARRENVQEFLSAAGAIVQNAGEEATLTDLLDHIALVSDLDGWEVDRGLSVMTLHSAKGLEFPNVFVLGLEMGVLPHYNSQERPEDIEEERRLLYVGMTRAEKKLMLAHCRRRRIAGRFQDQEPSPFLAEIPEELIDVTESPTLFDTGRTQGVSSFFGRSPAQAQKPEKSSGRGRRVRHPSLGEGTVLGVEGEGEAQKLTVFFDTAGKRKLVAKFANLEVL